MYLCDKVAGLQQTNLSKKEALSQAIVTGVQKSFLLKQFYKNTSEFYCIFIFHEISEHIHQEF